MGIDRGGGTGLGIKWVGMSPEVLGLQILPSDQGSQVVPVREERLAILKDIPNSDLKTSPKEAK